jgi:hypothetical protein
MTVRRFDEAARGRVLFRVLAEEGRDQIEDVAFFHHRQLRSAPPEDF